MNHKVNKVTLSPKFEEKSNRFAKSSSQASKLMKMRSPNRLAEKAKKASMH